MEVPILLASTVDMSKVSYTLVGRPHQSQCDILLCIRPKTDPSQNICGWNFCNILWTGSCRQCLHTIGKALLPPRGPKDRSKRRAALAGMKRCVVKAFECARTCAAHENSWAFSPGFCSPA
mmetsp:Transcript_36684/g.84625  ORF Transcript_36684/g.84625 Transcript_36684/m.84625 type:complete len:121 (-) Transcript_36684:7-369(-)